jgi:hypothetical protein
VLVLERGKRFRDQDFAGSTRHVRKAFGCPFQMLWHLAN